MLVVGLLLAGNLSGFGGSGAPVVKAFADTRHVRRAEGPEVRHAPLFWEQEAARQLIEQAATELRLAQDAKADKDADRLARTELLRAEFLALAETKQMRDQAREMFAVLVADEAERQDAQAAFMALMISML